MFLAHKINLVRTVNIARGEKNVKRVRKYGFANDFAWVTGRGQAIIPVPQTGFPYYGRVSPTIVSIALLGQMSHSPGYKNWSSIWCVRKVISIVTLAQETLPTKRESILS